MLLATFSSGLLSTPGRQVKYTVTSSMIKAIKIAKAVSQFNMQDHENEAFFMNESADKPNSRERGKVYRSKIAPDTFRNRATEASQEDN
jgi:hypothetical protein